MRRILLSLTLILCLLSGLILPAFAEEATSETDYPSDWPELTPLKISEDCVEFIKKNEGFAEYPLWDYGQYSVGYGSLYDEDKNPIPLSSPITRTEADYLLRYYLATFEEQVDKLLEKSTVEHTQSQYDAIISLTYNLGPQWMSPEYKIYQYILYGGFTEMDFVNTIGSWCNAGGGVLIGLCNRRMEEADMYLNGDYSLKNADYRCLIFNASPGKSSDTVEYYKAGEPLGRLPGATREGYHLEGWYTRASGGDQYTVDTMAPQDINERVRMAYAHWAEGDPNPDDRPEIPGLQFSDVSEGSWYYPWITAAVEQNLFSGVSDTEFEPEGTMTRAMLVTVLYRAAGSPDISVLLPFTDVPSGQWYSVPVQWAYTVGVVNGMSETEFGTDLPITREQLATMLYRFADYQEKDTSGRAALTGFTDEGEVSEFAVEALQWAVSEGIVNGDAGFLLPLTSATRAECAKMIVAYMN